MSNQISAKKTVKIKESHLVDLLERILNEAVEVKKQEWINEQASKNNDKTALLEQKLAELSAKVMKLTEGKK